MTHQLLDLWQVSRAPFPAPRAARHAHARAAAARGCSERAEARRVMRSLVRPDALCARQQVLSRTYSTDAPVSGLLN
jgi:hypothetical protein